MYQLLSTIVDPNEYLPYNIEELFGYQASHSVVRASQLKKTSFKELAICFT